MALDLTKVTKITFKDLLEDAVSSNDIKRLRFLEGLSGATSPRKSKKTGETTDAPISLMAIRSQYLKEFYGYKPAPKKEPVLLFRQKMIAEAYELLNRKANR